MPRRQGWDNSGFWKRRGGFRPVAAHPDDPVGDELDALLTQPEIRQRLEESRRRFERGETRTTPHEKVGARGASV